MSRPAVGLNSDDHVAMRADKAKLVATHIRTQLRSTRSVQATPSHGAPRRPLVVGVQGPQGSGKTTLTRQVVDALSAGNGSSSSDAKADSASQDAMTASASQTLRPLRVAVFSVDDLYLPFEGLQRVARENPGNALLSGRGQPGTHDVALGSQILSQLAHINEGRPGGGDESDSVHLPIFDKSLHGGKGDRSQSTVPVSSPLDVVLFEGWCLGFRCLSDDDLQRRYHDAISSSSSSDQPYFLRHELSHLEAINLQLRTLEQAWYPHIDAFVQLVPCDAPASSSDKPLLGGGTLLQTVFDWRLQAEHAMKAANGGKGMTDDEVLAFVERYMPGYELFGSGVLRPDAPWSGRMLRIGLDRDRQVTAAEYC
ncbi:unnamed protein product [Parajaminaea phylloscopi]